jgi:hypothetical protein
MSFPSFATSSKQVSSGQGGNLPSFKDMFVQLKAEGPDKPDAKNLRLIGFSIKVREHGPQKRDPNNSKEWIKVPFTDADQNKSFARYCTNPEGPDPDNCYWCKLGYRATTKFLQNALERQKDGTSIVRILEKGSTVFSEFFKWQEGNEDMNTEAGASGDDALCTHLGGVKAPDVRVKVSHNSQKVGNVEYTVNVFPKANTVSEEEIALLAAAGKPTQEYMDQARVALANLGFTPDDLPDWMFYGYNISKMRKPSELRQPGAATTAAAPVTPAAELSLGSDDEEEEAPKPVARRRAPAAPAAEAPASLGNPFDDDSDADTDADADGGSDILF